MAVTGPPLHLLGVGTRRVVAGGLSLTQKAPSACVAPESGIITSGA